MITVQDLTRAKMISIITYAFSIILSGLTTIHFYLCKSDFYKNNCLIIDLRGNEPYMVAWFISGISLLFGIFYTIKYYYLRKKINQMLYHLTTDM